MDLRQDEFETFTITDDSKADWAIDRIAEERAERDRLVNACDMRIETFERRKEQAVSDCENRTAFLLNALADYFSRVPHKATKTQESYALPSGKLVLRHPSPKIVRDEGKLLKWARENFPNLIATTENVDWANLKKALKAVDDHYIDPKTGVVVDGVKLEELPDSFDVKTEG